MNRSIAFVSVVVCSLSLPTKGSFAGAVPPSLFNKTIILAWNIQMSVSKAGVVKTINAPRERVIYISDKGRLFVRERRPDGRGNLNQIEERAPNNATNFTGNSSTVRFEGNQLIAITGQVSGANLMRATFDPSFSSCTMTWISGKSGSGRTIWKGSDGVTYDIVSATAGAMSCRVQSGNAFAG